MHLRKAWVACILLLIVVSSVPAVGTVQEVTEKDLLQQAKRLIKAGEVDKAIPLLQQALRLNPKSSAAHHFLGGCYMMQGRFDDALPLLEKSVALDPNNAIAWWVLGRLEYQRSNFARAEVAIKQALLLKPEQWEARVGLGIVYYAQGDAKGALEEFERAAQRAPAQMQQEDVVQVVAAAKEEFALMQTGREYTSAHFILRLSRDLPPSLAEMLLEEAEKAYEDIGGRFDDHPPAKTILVLVTDRERLVKALHTSIQAAALPIANRIFLTFSVGYDNKEDLLPDLWKEYTALVVSRLNYGMTPQWLAEALSNAIAQEKESAFTLIKIARMRQWLRTGKKLPTISEVDAAYTRMVSGSGTPVPSDIQAWIDSGVLGGSAVTIGKYLIERVGYRRLRQALREMGNGGEAQKALSAALGVSWGEFEAGWQKWAQEQYGSDHTTAEQHYGYALAYTNMGEWDNALREVQQAIALKPQEAAYYTVLAVVYGILGRKDEAMSACAQALRLNLTTPQGYSNVQLAYMRLGQLDEAIAVSERAIKEGYADSQVYGIAALVYLEKKQPQAALPLALKAVELDPIKGIAQKALLRAYVDNGMQEKAIALGNKLVELTPNPTSGDVYYWIGIAYRDKGDKERAKAALEKALALGYEEAKEALEALKK